VAVSKQAQNGQELLSTGSRRQLKAHEDKGELQKSWGVHTDSWGDTDSNIQAG